jgi:hypothetical protein
LAPLLGHWVGQFTLNKAIAICALLSLVPISGLSAARQNPNWVKVRSTPRGTYYVDVRSIRVRGNSRDYWDKTVYDVTDPKRVSVDITRWRVDCANHRDMMLYSEAFLKSRTFAGGAGIPESQRIWENIIPTSTAAVLLKFVCSR